MRRRLSPYAADTCTIDEPSARAAASACFRSSTFTALATDSGGVSTSFGLFTACLVRSTTRALPLEPRAAALAASAAARSPDSLRSAVWA